MINLAIRNLKIFFRQKSAVFFSLLGVFVIIGLYVVFLGDAWADSYPLPGVGNLMTHWIIAGIVSVASITTTMGAFGIMVEDRVNKNSKDFLASPIGRSQLVGGYVLSSGVVGAVMSLLAFTLGEIYIVWQGGELLSLAAMARMAGAILLSVSMSCTMVFFLVSFFHSLSAFSTASTILGTLIGFVTGIYLPIGTLPDYVQWVVKLFPVSHASALMRQIMMEVPLQDSFAAAPPEYLTWFKEAVGIVYTYGDYTAQAWVSILVLGAGAVVFFLLAVANASRKKV